MAAITLVRNRREDPSSPEPGSDGGRSPVKLVTAEAVRCLRAIATRFQHQFEFQDALLGGIAIDATGDPLPPATLAACEAADAVLMGAIGGPRWSSGAARPEQGLLRLRRALGVFANLRPVTTHPAVLDAAPLKAEVIRGVDIMVVRELTGGIYFGAKSRTPTNATDLCEYSAQEIERDREYFANYGFKIPIAIGKRGVEEAYKVGGIPQIMAIDKTGRIRLIMIGYDDANEERLAAFIKSLLAEPLR